MEERKDRFTISTNKIPDDVYRKLDQKGEERKLATYIVNLVEKEEQMDKMIASLSIISELSLIPDMLKKIENIERVILKQPGEYTIRKEELSEAEDVKQGQLNISENVQGGIVEEITDFDF